MFQNKIYMSAQRNTHYDSIIIIDLKISKKKKMFILRK